MRRHHFDYRWAIIHAALGMLGCAAIGFLFLLYALVNLLEPHRISPATVYCATCGAPDKFGPTIWSIKR